ncbi:class I SAM-dependent methyltransferase [Polynucleobacter sp. AP-Latsch-80-C2]|jgi:O-antigen chain-terminating methyltransferase|uniref:class I SAM-dependent methyltransferase n=1 Tax=Polynucleobacter sp. AP-Latsch-80-C2 TaxID=2576931 RepID=UPI001C0C1C14|nr:class I SAM-dependent methyltransferase [Polynucleobacter sp. AP-Latsch-80-C2]MBU3623941.1 class I SAM-dependent methyltransferase [Polynucleobacter sp. AP-Latsch-80-C2]
MSSDQNNFYKAFEDQHRGSREVIKSRLSVYVPFIKKIQAAHPNATALDLGCGRGEWLELLQDNQLTASGIDLDDGMLSACRSRGLNVQTGDAIAHLKSLPADSLSIVSGFHIAEHLSLDDLQTLIKEALRTLKPAGLLILEAPNTENLVVGTSSFYLDPTHQRPLPSALLSFLVSYLGFARSKVLGVQESIPLREEQGPTSLFAVLSGVSPDFAVIAQKAGDASAMASFDVVFAKEYGLTLELLANRYQERFDAIERKTQLLEARLNRIWKLLEPFKWAKSLFKK